MTHIIGGKAVRVILLKTAVGWERYVFDKYKEHLDKDDNIEAWQCYKIFGDYDLCFILVRNNLDHDMLTSGTIDGITYSTELLCYTWDDIDGIVDLTLKDLSAFPLVGLIILKIEPYVLADAGPGKIEQEFLNLFGSNRNMPEVIRLGTFGWNEFIIVYPINSFIQIYSELIQKVLNHKYGDYRSCFIKSFSLVGVNYNNLSDSDMVNELNTIDVSNVYPSIFVACRPCDMKRLYNNLTDILNTKNGIRVEKQESLIFGANDFMLKIKEWKCGDLINALLYFRKTYRSAIFKTSVQLCSSYLLPDDIDDGVDPIIFSPYTISINSDGVNTLKKLKQPLDETIISTIYTFNQYLRNELLFDSVEDMIDYVGQLAEKARRFANGDENSTNKEYLNYLENMPETIRMGCYQRLAGFLLQEGSEDFSSYKGGKQRLLKALKALSKDIIDDVLEKLGIGRKWNGFVTIGRHNYYSHSWDVLAIPIDTAFRVEKYFGIFHEIGHLILLLQSNDKIIDLDGISNEKEERPMLEDMFCDLFAFLCGFLGMYDLYVDTIMPYVANILKKHYNREHIEKYALRLLVVMSFHMIRDDKRDKIDSAAELLLEKYFEEIKDKRNIPLKRKIIDDFKKSKELFCDVFIGSFRKIENILENTFNKQRKSVYHSKEYKQQFDKILCGNTVDDLRYPHLVVLSMIENSSKLSFKAETAAIRSFINYYYNNQLDKALLFYYDTEQLSETIRQLLTIIVPNVNESGNNYIETGRELISVSIPGQIIRINPSPYIDDAIAEEIKSAKYQIRPDKKDYLNQLLISLGGNALYGLAFDGAKVEFVVNFIKSLGKYLTQ
ncbi:MAG: hypothetical protein HQK99_08575 [Nitrospirae bacterium]|nr:hypothetical protein [Nitrospirota bacterium]